MLHGNKVNGKHSLYNIVYRHKGAVVPLSDKTSCRLQISLTPSSTSSSQQQVCVLFFRQRPPGRRVLGYPATATERVYIICIMYTVRTPPPKIAGRPCLRTVCMCMCVYNVYNTYMCYNINTAFRTRRVKSNAYVSCG